jgi:iron complex outermembrane receptor protein
VGLLLGVCAGAAAQQGPSDSQEELAAVTVTATRIAQPSFDVPASVDTELINPDALAVNVAESLQDVPGLLARDRQNYAQDEQISVRGFGARTTFGIVGVRVYTDGIPANQPDGQGEVSQFNLASADRVEVLRGPFSALYGNSAGGVIQLFTPDGSGPPQLDAGVAYGSFSERRASADVLGSEGPFSYNVGLSQFATDGSRGHSAAQRSSLQGKWGFDFAAAGKLTLIANVFNSPSAQDPLGLTRAQFNADPEGTAPTAVQYNTRKGADQRQLGAIYELNVNDSNTFRLMAYGGHRDVLQFQAIPVSTQLAPTSPGGVVDLNNGYGGVEPRWTYHSRLLGGPWSVTAGLTYDVLDEHRFGYNNFIGPALGILGVLRHAEVDRVYDQDQYLQTQWDPVAPLSVTLGLRHSEVAFSGFSYAAGSPVAGLVFHVDPRVNLYASFGDGFQTPTVDQLAYRPNGEPGLNSSLRAERSHSFELGAKFRVNDDTGADLALFRADSTNEVVVESNTGGRSIYGNAGPIRHQGVELEAHTQLQQHLRLQLAYTYLDVRVRGAYLTCEVVPCAKATTLIPVGNRVPGVPPDDLYAQLQWEPLTDWHWVLTDSYVANVFVDDVNSTYAGAYDVFALATDYSWHLPTGVLRGFVRVDNLLNRAYAGSVIVNQSSKEFFEAGPGRAVLAGLDFEFK